MRHFFCDSLKRFLMALVATLAFVAPTFADEAIQSVTVVGATEQSGTPTPSAPANIKTNNGVIKVSPNLLKNPSYVVGWINDSGILTATSGNTSLDYFPVTPNTTYTFSYQKNQSSYFDRVVEYSNNTESGFLQVLVKQDNRDISMGSIVSSSFTTGPNAKYIRVYMPSAQPGNIQKAQLEQGSTATPYRPYGEIYFDGTVETIADSANHTATVATLLGVGDYRDTQNINTGAITRNIGVKVLDGTEGFGAPYKNVVFLSKDALGMSNAKNATNLVSSHFIYAAYTPSQSINNGVFITSQGQVGFSTSAIGNTATAVNDWLAEQYANGTPVIIVYPLATETTESVTAQTMTTAPVRQVSGSLRTTIRTILTNGQELVTGSISSGIQIATTKYTEDAFAGLITTLSEAITKVTNIVDTTVQQATEIGNLATTKQDRPDTDCPAGRKCLLIMGADNKPHWYLIQE